MPVLIDGNNLLFVARDMETEGPELGRAGLCRYLGDWSRLSRQAVRLVFDGREPMTPELARQIAGPDLVVLYSGAARSADDVLIELLETDSAARRLTVVSSDREIARAARRRRASVLRSDEFWRRLRRALDRPPRRSPVPRSKRFGPDQAETEQWLREFGLHWDPTLGSEDPPPNQDAQRDDRRPQP
jgi:hypothetical protein